MLIILFLLIAFKLFFIAYPSVVLPAAREGLTLWLNNVLPALLPFMVISNMLTAMGYSRLVGNFFAPIMRKVFALPGAGGVALVTGLTSGYPLGAKAIADLRRTGQLTSQEAQHLLAFCNNAGPLFIIGVVGVGLFGSARFGYMLLAGHIMAALLVGVIVRAFMHKHRSATYTKQERQHGYYTQNTAAPSFESAFSGAIKAAVESIIVIGGVIIFFNVISAVILHAGLPDHRLFSGFATALVEVTSGVRRISETGISVASVAITAFAIAFGGISIHMQTLHFTDGTGIRAIYYILGKLLHGTVAAAVTLVLWLTIFRNFVV